MAKASGVDVKAKEREAPVKLIEAPPKPRLDRTTLRKRIEAAEDKVARFEDLIRRIDAALAKPGAFATDKARARQLSQQRGELARALGMAEEEWLALSAQNEAAA